MNLVIVDEANRKYHPYIYCTETQALFVMENIIKINTKNKTYLNVQENVDFKYFENMGYEMDQALFDRLVLEYNSNLDENEERLDLWTRDK